MSPDALLQSIPAADPLPLAAPALLFRGLLLLTSILHLVSMNLLVGGVLLAVAARIAGTRRSSAAHLEVSQAIASILPVLVAATVTLGVAPLLFVQVLYGRLFFVSSILLGWWWLAVVPLLIAAYYAAYAARGGSARALFVVAILLPVVGAILSTNMTLMIWPGEFRARYFADPAGIWPDVIDAANIARWLHFMIAAVAVAGLALAAWGVRIRAARPAAGQAAMQTGLAAFWYGTAVNVVVGLVWLGLLPVGPLRAFVGGDVRSSVLMGVAVVLGAWTAWAGYSAWSARLESGVRHVIRSGTVLGATVIVMVLVRDRLRTLMLEPAGYTFPPASPQWDVIAIFAVCLVAAVVLIVWMVGLLVRSMAKSRHREVVST